MVDEVSAGLNPVRYVAGLGCAAMRAGAAIFENAKLQRIERLSRNGACEFRVTTSRGALWARNVFAGTSGYTGAATPALRKKIIPIGSYIIFFFQAEDGIRDPLVTGVQTCALPI